MTAALPPHDRDRLAALYRERNPDPRDLVAERERPIPPAPGVAVPARRRRGDPLPSVPRPGPPSYAAQHARLRDWLRRDHPVWLPELYTLGDTVAHVVIERTTLAAMGLCGEDGHPEMAPDIAPPCPRCLSFVPRADR